MRAGKGKKRKEKYDALACEDSEQVAGEPKTRDEQQQEQQSYGEAEHALKRSGSGLSKAVQNPDQNGGDIQKRTEKRKLPDANTGGCTGKKQGSKLVSEEKEEREKVESEQKTAG